jgi:Tfp pilus assembly protein PilX
MIQHNRHTTERGAVSLFIVIFAALLITIVTVGFVQLMVRDQQQATLSDLSQSAYDSAEAGVEDAKRLLLLDQACRNNTAAPSINCAAIASALTPAPGESETSCNTLSQAGLVGDTNGETIIEQSDSDGSDRLDQAYTCVKVGVNTDDYKGTIGSNQSDIVPITGVGTFDRVEISWFSRDDVSSTTNSPNIGFPTTGADISLPRLGTTWEANHPSMMRMQLMQMGEGFRLTEFDDSQPDNKSNANTLFLYPSATGLVTKDFALDARRSPSNAPQKVRCNASFNDGEYACTVTVTLPSPIDGNTAQRNAYLRLSSLYNGAHYSLRLKNGDQYVQFNGVQPLVDSTGRANDVFRRIQARVELIGDFTYPEAAIDMEGNLCKNFTVTDNDDGYKGTTSCTP